MGFKNQSVFTTTYTNTTFTVTEGMGIESITINLVSGSATLLGGLQFPGLTLSSVALSVGQPVVLNVNSGYTLTDITVDSTAGGIFQVYTIYAYNNALDPSAAAYLAATGITGPVQSAAIDTLVKSLKATNLWSNMKAIYPFVTDNRNLLSYTEDFGNVYWGKDTGVTVNSNTTNAPNGTLTADTVNISGLNKALYSPQVSTALGVVMKISFYIKATSGQEGKTVWVRTPWSEVGQFITLTSEWVRQEINYITNGITYGVEWSNKNSATATSFFLWGAQLELGSTATTYQPIANTQQSFISNQFKYNLVNPVDSDAAFRLVFNGGWTFSTNGATPNGTNGYADTFLVPSSVLSQNSTHLSFYSRSNILNTLQFEIGSFNLASAGLGSSSFAISYNSIPNGHMRNRVSTATPSTGFIPTDARGLFVSNRTTSTQQKAYQNGVLKETANVNSDGLSTLPIAISANRISSIALGDYSAKQTAFSSIGDGLTDAQAANLYTIVQAYETALSRQV